ncbi:MAG: hypothetical protein CME18_00730 [Gemmatimonadetes bacterium]|nr:hypothetical protein [Gemmatimonadota bacterium]MEE2862604.1 hypothetical protein [Gemmatimonadota bacterium]
MARTDSIHESEIPTKSRGVQELTEIEQQILDYMVQYLRANTFQPSIRDIGERFEIKSTKTVSEYLQALEAKGYLERHPSRSRGVKILGVDLGGDAVSVPCFSSIAVGTSGDASPETLLSLDPQFGSREGSFLVRAKAGELGVLGVSEGDLVLISPVELGELEDGAVIVIGSSDAASFFRFLRSGSSFSLEDLKPGGRTTVSEQPALTGLVGRVAGFYRKMDEVGSLNLTPH